MRFLGSHDHGWAEVFAWADRKPSTPGKRSLQATYRTALLEAETAGVETVGTTPKQVEAETVGSTPLVGSTGELNATEEAAEEEEEAAEAEEEEAEEEEEGGEAAAPQSAAAQPAAAEPATAESEAASGTEGGTEGGVALGQRAAEDGKAR